MAIPLERKVRAIIKPGFPYLVNYHNIIGSLVQVLIEPIDDFNCQIKVYHPTVGVIITCISPLQIVEEFFVFPENPALEALFLPKKPKNPLT